MYESGHPMGDAVGRQLVDRGVEVAQFACASRSARRGPGPGPGGQLGDAALGRGRQAPGHVLAVLARVDAVVLAECPIWSVPRRFAQVVTVARRECTQES